MDRLLCLILMGAGLVLILASLLWPQEMAARAAWSEEKAVQRQSAGHLLHSLQGAQAHAKAAGSAAHGHAGYEHGAPDPAAIEEARRQFEGTTSSLQAVRNGQAWIVGLMKWLGVGLAAAGTGWLLFQREGR